jgi:GxxExxY protein
MLHEEVSGAVITAAMKVHSALGPGLLESAYEACLAYELRQAGLGVETQLELPVVYEGVRVDVGYRIDLLAAGAVIVEVKSVGEIAPIHKAQLLSYLRLSGVKVGLLLNFNVLRLRDGLTRVVL